MSKTRCPFAEWRPSPDHGPRKQPVEFVVIHITDGGPSEERTADHFDRSEGDAHFIVGRTGRILQLVELDRVAWHCSGWNGRSIGIEHCARTPGEFDRRGRWAALSHEKRSKLLDAGAQPELVASDNDPGLPVTDAQLRASTKLLAWCLRAVGLPLRRGGEDDTVRAHCEAPGTTHLDCGRDVELAGIWPWTRYLDLVRLELAALELTGGAEGVAVGDEQDHG